MAKLITIYTSNADWELFEEFITELNEKYYPAKVYISSFMKELTKKYINEYNKEK